MSELTDGYTLGYSDGVKHERERIMNHDDEEGIIRIKADSIQLLVDAAKKETEERIIKLLEANRIPCDCGDSCNLWDSGYDEAISLIKRETE